MPYCCDTPQAFGKRATGHWSQSGPRLGWSISLVWFFFVCVLLPGPLGAEVLVTSGDGTLTLVADNHASTIVAEEGVPPAKSKTKLEERDFTHCLVLSADKTTYATVIWGHGCRYRTDIVRRGPPTKILASLIRDKEPLSLAVAPDGSYAAIGTDTQVILLSSKTGRASPLVRTPKKTRALAYSPDGKGLAVGDEAGHVRQVAIKTGKVLWEHRAHVGEVRQIVFSGDGKSIASGSDDGTIRVSRADTGERIQYIRAHLKSVLVCAISHDGSLVGSVGTDRCITAWDVKKAKQLFYQPIHLNSEFSGLAFTTDSKLVFASGQFRGVLDAKTGKVLYSNEKIAKPKDGKEEKAK